MELITDYKLQQLNSNIRLQLLSIRKEGRQKQRKFIYESYLKQF